MKPIVFLHGFACDTDHFDRLRGAFPERRTMALPWTEYVDDALPPVDAVHSLIDRLANHLHEQRFADAVLVGHSLGGALALLLATRSDLQASGLILIDSSWPLSTERKKAYLALGASFLDPLEADPEAGVQDAFARWATTSFREKFFLPDDEPNMVERIVQQASHRPVAANAKTLVGTAQIDISAALRQVHIPLLAVGSQKPFISIEDIRALCPAVEYRQVSKGGHFVMFFAPDELSAFVREFLTNSIVQ